MDDKYIRDIYDNLGGESVFGGYDDYYSLITTDDSYIKDVYNSQGESVFGAYNDFVSLVKKKDDSVVSTSQEVATESTTKGDTTPTSLESSGVTVDTPTLDYFKPNKVDLQGVNEYLVSMGLDEVTTPEKADTAIGDNNQYENIRNYLSKRNEPVDLNDRGVLESINKGLISDEDLILAGYKDPEVISTIKRQPTQEEIFNAKQKIYSRKTKTSDEIDFAISQFKLDKPYIYEEKSSEDLSFIEYNYNSEDLSEANVNIKDFDGFLNEKGLKQDFINKAKTFESTYGSIYDLDLAKEMELSRMLDLYISEQSKRDIKQQKLQYEKEQGIDPDLTDDKYSFKLSDKNVSIPKINEYYKKNYPKLTEKLLEADSKNRDLYKKYLEGDFGTLDFLKEFGDQGYEGFETRLQNLSASFTDFIGFSNTAQGIRFQIEQEKLVDGDNLSYSYVGGKKVNIDGKNYIVDSNNQVYDADLKIRVTNYIDEDLRNNIIDKSVQFGTEDFSISSKGMAFETSNIVGDMAVQIGLQGSFTSGGKIISAISNTDKVRRVLGYVPSSFKQLTKGLTIDRGIASSILAQSTLGASSGYEDTLLAAKEAGLSDKESVELARDASIQMAKLYALTAPISPQTKATEAIFGKIKNETIKDAIKAYKNIGKEGFIEIFEKAGRKATTYFEEGLKEAAQENIQQSGETLIVNKRTNELAGVKLKEDEVTVDSFINTSLLSFTSGFLMPFGGDLIGGARSKSKKLLGIDGVDRIKALRLLSENQEKLEKLLEVQQNKGIYSKSEVDELLGDVRVYKDNVSKIPSDLKSDTALDIISDLESIRKLENKKKSLDPSFHEEIDKEISEIRESIKQKTKEDAIQEQETRDIPAAEPAEGVQEMEEGVREPSIEEKKQEIEQRRQEELFNAPNEMLIAPMISDGKGGFIANPEIAKAKEVKEEINAKYDAELKALESTETEVRVTPEEKVTPNTFIEVDSPIQDNLQDNETIVQTREDNKGRVFTTTKQESVRERDGMKVTKFKFNRSDKATDQRNDAFVPEEVALEGTNLEINPEDRLEAKEGDTITYEISEIREGETGAGASVRFTTFDADGNQIGSFQGDVTLVEKTDTEQAVQETEEVTITPETSSNYANMTEDGEGNFVFYHVGQEGYSTIEPRSGDTKATSPMERSALSKVGGLAMYYTAPETGEGAVTGKAKYQVKVPVEKVYDFNNDPLNFNEEGKKRHSEENPGKAYDANTSLAYVTKIAGEKGFDMVVAEWNGRTRAQTTKSLTPTDTQVKEGNTIVKPFENQYESNTDKGFRSVIPESKQSKLDALYNKIYKERNKENRYDDLYRIQENAAKMSQDEITELIENSDISQEIKDEYKTILDSKEEVRRSIDAVKEYLKELNKYRKSKTKNAYNLDEKKITKEEYEAENKRLNKDLTAAQKRLNMDNKKAGIETRDERWDKKSKKNLPKSNIKNAKELNKKLEEGTWGMLTAENPDANIVTDKQNAEANKRAEEWLKSKGYSFTKIFGKYGNSENSYFVDGLTYEDAVAFSKEFNQESVATNEGLVYQDGKINPKEGQSVNTKDKDLYSTIRTDEGLVDFQVGYDFSQKIKPSKTDGVSKLREMFGRKAAGAMRVNTVTEKLAIEQQADKARKAIAKRYPDMEIEVFYNEADYHRAIGEADQSKGTYFNNKVYINLTRATETTVAHEVFHGILSNELKNNAQVQALMKRFVDSLSRSQDPALVAIFAEEVAKVERYKDVQNEEIMAELFGTLAGEYKRLKPQTKSLINRLLERVAKLLGLKKFTDAEVIDVLNTLAGKIATGQEVTTEDVSIISSVDNGTMQENTYLETDGIVVQTPSKRSSLINANIKASDLLDTADIAGKPLEVVYYDNFTSMPYSLRNRVSGSVLNRQGEGGPGYSYRKVIKDNKIIGAFTTVTKGLNLIQGIRSRNEVAKENAVLGIALQNKETGHLGNKTTSRDFYHPTEGVIAQSVKDGVITNKQAVNMLKDAVDAYSKTSKGKDAKSSLGFTSQDFSSLDQFFELFDNISFERRGTFNSTIIPSKSDLKITKATKPHTKMWIDSGVPTLRDYNEATAEPYTKSAKSHDVVKYLDPDLNSIGIDSSVEVSDAERKRSEEMGVKIVRIDDKASHTSYPVVLFGRNIGVPKFFHSLRDMANEWNVPNPFFKAGRRKDTDTPKRIPEGLESERKADVTKKKQVSGRPSIDEIVRRGKENNISDANIRQFAKEEGYSIPSINRAIEAYNEEKRIEGQKGEKMFTGKNVVFKFLDKAYRHLLSSKGFMPKSMHIGKEVMNGAIEANLKQAKQTLKDMQRFLKKFKGDEDTLIQNLNKYMRGYENVDILPEKLQPIAFAMRTHIDSLSKQLIDSGAVSDIRFDDLKPKQKEELIKRYGTEEEARNNYRSLQENILNNIGTYMTRSYEVFDNKDYKPTDEVMLAAENKLREIYLKKATEIAEKENNTVSEVLDRMVTKKIEDILTPEGANAFLTGSKLGSKKTSILKERLDIPSEIRALMGEYTDPALNYARSIQKMSALVANQKFLNKMKEAGEGVFFFTEEDLEKNPGLRKEFSTKIAAETSDTMNPLSGMYTTKDIARAMTNSALISIDNPIIEGAYNFWLKSVGAVKYSKTILSPATHAKNIVGNLAFMAYNGYINPKDYADAFKVIMTDLRNLSKEEQRAKLQEYIKAGIINQSATLGDIRAMFDSKDSVEDMLIKRMNDPQQSLVTKGKKIFKKFGKGAEAAYQAEDDFFKIVAYENEKKRYAKAFFKKDFNDLTASEAKEVTDYISEIVKNILPNYSRIGELGKIMKAVPVAGTFISFQIEAMRTAYNTVDLAFTEIKDPKTRSIGLKRLTGIMSVIGLKAALFGTFGLFGDDEEDELVSKSRNLLPPWAKNSNIVITESGKGKFKYINLSASDPHGFLDKALIGYMRGDSFGDSMASMTNELVGPFFQKDILFNTMFNILENNDDYGREIWGETDSPNETTKKIVSRLWKAIEPGGVTSVKKVIGSETPFNEFIGQMTGFKEWEIDVKDQVLYKSKNIKERSSLAGKDYGKAFFEFKDGKITQKELDRRYEEANSRYKQIINEGIDIYETGIIFGVPMDVLNKQMSGGSRFSKYEIDLISKGIVPDKGRGREGESDYIKMLKKRSRKK